MGRRDRVTKHGLLALALALLAGAGCDREAARVEEQRREVLKLPDHNRLRAERAERDRIFDDEGLPLESELVLAGIPMPRSFAITRESSEDWYLESRLVSAELAGRYIEKRVYTEKISRTGGTGVAFEIATARSAPNGPKLKIVITPIANMPNASEMYVRKPAPPAPPKILPSEAESQAMIEAQRRSAD